MSYGMEQIKRDFIAFKLHLALEFVQILHIRTELQPWSCAAYESICQRVVKKNGRQSVRENGQP